MPFISLLKIVGLDKYLGHIVGGILFLALASGTYYIWKSSVEQQALADYNRVQLEQAAQQNQQFERLQEQLDLRQRAIAREQYSHNIDLQRRVDSLINELNRMEDRPASAVLRRTIDELRGMNQ